jgi:hypothetical protein
MKHVMQLLAVALLTAAVGLVVNLPSASSSPRGGNDATYSGNGKGEQDAALIQGCAFFAADALRDDPSLNGDALFVLCLDENGVWAI